MTESLAVGRGRRCHLLVIITLCAVMEVTISQTDESITVQGMVGDTVTLPGNFSYGHDEAVIALTWTKLDPRQEGTRHFVHMFTPNGTSVASDELKGRAVFHKNGSFTIRDIREEDEGQYVMTLLIDVIGQREHFVKLDVVVPPIVDLGVKSPYGAPVGTDVRLNCTVDKSNSLVYSVSWFKDGRPLLLPRLDFTDKVFYRSSVVLKNFTSADSGNYSCVANSLKSQETGSVILEATYPARVTNISTQPIITAGDSTTLWCTTTGNPPPKVTWYKNGRKIYAGVTTEGNVTYIKIKRVRTSDVGKYKCAVSNGLGEDSRTVYLSVGGVEVTASSSSSELSISERWLEFGIIVGGAVVGTTLLLTSFLIIIFVAKRRKSKSGGCQTCHVLAISHSQPNLHMIGDDMNRQAYTTGDLDPEKPLSGRYLARAIRDYKPTQEGGLTLEVNDIVELLYMGRDGWWYGYLRGSFGFFPAGAVIVITGRRRLSMGQEDRSAHMSPIGYRTNVDLLGTLPVDSDNGHSRLFPQGSRNYPRTTLPLPDAARANVNRHPISYDDFGDD
ncbi:HMCN1 [Branchiostoma lanceolatum]|uniref:HMCN1 protein n=1 Tax=Branchiostoma lanceolatum TaxID=7740 RepID=A0A8K0E6C9_BRALA|nr:HMCN1 [Branchiostoma lanceolatum]